MNSNVISQLISIFIIVSLGPAVVVYLSFKKQLEFEQNFLIIISKEKYREVRKE